MNTTKTLVAAGLLLAAGTFTIAHAQSEQVVWSCDAQVLAQQPQVALIRPSPEADGHSSGMISMQSETGPRTIATGVSLTNVVTYAYNFGNVPNFRLIMPSDTLHGCYDYMVTLPQGGREAMQQLLQQQFGLTARRETREVDALVLTVSNTNAPSLRANPNARGGGGGGFAGGMGGGGGGFVGGAGGGGFGGGGFSVQAVREGTNGAGGQGQVVFGAASAGTSGSQSVTASPAIITTVVQAAGAGTSGSSSTQTSFPAGTIGMNGVGARMSFVASALERLLGQPVIDQTGLTGPYDYSLSYNRGASADEIKQAVLDQLGLALTPSPNQQSVDFLVVEKAQ